MKENMPRLQQLSWLLFQMGSNWGPLNLVPVATLACFSSLTSIVPLPAYGWWMCMSSHIQLGMMWFEMLLLTTVACMDVLLVVLG
jgi:hypothetical protein